MQYVLFLQILREKVDPCELDEWNEKWEKLDSCELDEWNKKYEHVDPLIENENLCNERNFLKIKWN